MLLKTHGRKFPTESEDKLHVYKHVVTLFISVTREEVHRARLGRRVTTHARCNVCILAGEFNTVYSCEPRFWKCHDENSPTLNLSFVSTSTADFFLNMLTYLIYS